jgi:protein TonB
MGAAAAPAFAPVVPDSPVAAKALDHAEDVSVIEKPAELNQGKAYAETTVPTFTFGGANAPAESSGGSKKILLAVAVAAIVAAGLYFGWTRMQTPSPQTPSVQPVASSPAPAPVQSALALQEKPAPLPNSQMPLPVTADSTPAPSTTTEREVSSVTLSAKTPSKPASLATEALKPAPSQKVLKVGNAPASSAADTVDAQAPSMIGIASTTAPPAFTSNTAVPRSAQSMNISQGVARGLLITKVQPIYPKTALNLRVEGTVELLATISRTGDISSVKVLSGNSQLTKAAADAVKQWKYKPYLLNGEPVDIQTQVTINFSLPH